MPEVKMEFPHVIVVENLEDKGRINLATNKELVKNIEQQAARGVVTKEGTWAISPGPWEVQKLSQGSYKVTHNWGYFNVSLSLTLLQQPGTIKATENHPTYFTVETYLEGELTDMPFAFTLVKVISP